MTDYIVASGRVLAKMCSINMQYCYRAAAIQLGSLVSILAYSVYVIKVNKLNSSQNSCLSYSNYSDERVSKHQIQMANAQTKFKSLLV